jgi:hypothetical protein
MGVISFWASRNPGVMRLIASVLFSPVGAVAINQKRTTDVILNEVKNLEVEILRRAPQDDTATQSVEGKKKYSEALTSNMRSS